MKLQLVSIFIFFVVVGFEFAFSSPFQKANECVLNKNCVGHDWKLQARSQPENEIRLIFAIKQKNVELLEKILYDVSDPKSKNYGKHLSFEEVGRLTSSPESESAVRKCLLSSSVEERNIISTINKEFMIVELTVSKAESFLNTEFYDFFSEKENKTIQRTYQYDVPKEIASHIDFVSNTVQFPSLVQKFGLLVSGDPSSGVSPALLSKYYNITSNDVSASNATQSLFEIGGPFGQTFSPSDLLTFEQYYGLPQNPVSRIIGPDQPFWCKRLPNSCGESNLDVQWIMAIAQNANTTYWSVKNSFDPFLNWVLQVANDSNPPLVHSISYGSSESESDKPSIERFNLEVGKLGARGITVLVASGDDGVSGPQARTNSSNCGFSPSYPATCPYVTAVGATQGPEEGNPEIMCSSSTGGLITSGGGFSGIFSQPSYQAKQVQNYLQNGPDLPPKNLFASTGRAYPDVALLGNRFNIVIGNKWLQVCGTSASSPSVGGIVTLVNSLRLNKGKSPLGFLNPLLYGLNTDSFHDITKGKNNCCAGQSKPVCCQYGFSATTGWDPTTGLGSINFAEFAPNALGQ